MKIFSDFDSVSVLFTLCMLAYFRDPLVFVKCIVSVWSCSSLCLVPDCRFPLPFYRIRIAEKQLSDAFGIGSFSLPLLELRTLLLIDILRFLALWPLG